MEEITQRNFYALSEGLKEQRSVNSEQDKRIKHLESSLADTQNKLETLLQNFNMFKYKDGVGVTSRG